MRPNSTVAVEPDAIEAHITHRPRETAIVSDE